MMKKLRSGYTTGACAAAAAKAATELILSGQKRGNVTIPFPDTTRVTFDLEWCRLERNYAITAVIKDGGDDPDATNGALIAARVEKRKLKTSNDDFVVIVKSGTGVGTVTKPGLAVGVGSPAINPVPMSMIKQAVREAVDKNDGDISCDLIVTIIVPEGERIAEKTLNKRLGILGGISILGTTGIVRPISADAWTATISASMAVAAAAGVKDIVLSTGRTSEKCVEAILKPPEESLVMMGDYLDFSLKEVRKHKFSRVHMSAMWAKLLKGAMRHPNTHVRHGVLETCRAISFLKEIGVEDTITTKLEGSNTAREMLTRLLEMERVDVLDKVARIAQVQYRERAGIPVTVYLVDGPGNLLRLIE